MSVTMIQKRDGRIVPFEKEKIVAAIQKANAEVTEPERAEEPLIEEILDDVLSEDREKLAVEHVQDMIEEHLVKRNKYILAKKYIYLHYNIVVSSFNFKLIFPNIQK